LASCVIRLHWSLSWAFLLHPSIPISTVTSFVLVEVHLCSLISAESHQN
jgi:hypothetical protein